MLQFCVKYRRIFQLAEFSLLRALFVAASIGLALAAATPSRAADYDYPAASVRAVPFVVYDYEPGIAVREYWLAPWRNHHYFPRGQRTKSIAHSGRLLRRPAQSYHREWHTSPSCGHCGADTQSSGLETETQGNGNQTFDKQIIHADADVTVLGPDRMDIRLSRKRGKRHQ